MLLSLSTFVVVAFAQRAVSLVFVVIRAAPRTLDGNQAMTLMFVMGEDVRKLT